MNYQNELNIFIRIWHFLTLKTYHNDLLTKGGSNYLTLMSFIIFFSALAEAFAWGYLGSTFTGKDPLIGWIGVGLFVFLVLWFFDRAMATYDVLKDEHELTLNGLPKEKPYYKNIKF